LSTNAARPSSEKNGEYNYNSSIDQYLVRFLGLDLEALLKELATGKADGEILVNASVPSEPLIDVCLARLQG
jgi:Domain of unknown function (DUF5069)